MRSRALIRTLFQSAFLIRFIAAVGLLISLALAGSGALLARPLGPVLSDDTETGDRSRVSVSASIDAPRASAAAPQPTASKDSTPSTAKPAPSSDSVPPVALGPAPASLPTANLSAMPPAPDLSRPPWAVSARETGLWSGPTGGTLFSKVLAGATFRVLDIQSGRFRVFYPGDGAKQAPGEVWVDAADLSAVAWPRWVRLRRPGNVVTLPSADGVLMATVKPGEYVEVVGEARGSWAHVNYLGDGRGPAADGWLEAEPTIPLPGPDVITSFAMTYDLLKAGGPAPWIKVPYRSQLDGAPYSAANCGPTATGMVLEEFGFKVPPPALRQEILSLQPNENCDDCGVYLQNMAEVVARRGLKITGLRDSKPDEFHRWTQDEIRNELRAGHPIIAQVFYRRLPARASSPYWGDHFIVLSGMLGDRFVFNDPIDIEGPGYSRLITAQALDLAMGESDFPYAAFSVGT